MYPVTIIKTRYGGSYEGGQWAAFHLDAGQIPPDAEGDDISCSTWWTENAWHVGVGYSPTEAYTDLCHKTQENRKQR